MEPEHEEHSWKMASTWVGSRDATQIRTHVQKYKKDKVVHWVRLAETLASRCRGKLSAVPHVTKKEKGFLHERVLEYLQMVIYSFEQQECGANTIIHTNVMASEFIPTAVKEAFLQMPEKSLHLAADAAKRLFQTLLKDLRLFTSYMEDQRIAVLKEVRCCQIQSKRDAK